MGMQEEKNGNSTSVFKRILFGVYIPSLFVFSSRSLIIPLIPLYAMELGANKATASLITGVTLVSRLLIDLPVGFLVGRIGEKFSMKLSLVSFIFAALLSGFVRNLWFLSLTLFISGFATSLWLVSVMSYIRHHSKTNTRGRFLSGVGGIMRLGRIVSPVVAGYIAERFGYFYLFFISSGLFFVAFVQLLFFSGKHEGEIFRVRGGNETTDSGDSGGVGEGKVFNLAALKTVIGESKGILLTTGVTMMVLGLIRNAYQIALPILGKSVGLSISAIGSIMGLLSAGGLLMVIPAGFVMDKLGRKWSLGICMASISLGLGFILLFKSVDGFIIVALLMGLGNGMGSGINMTMGSDVAKGKNVGAFLGLWRFISDAGRISAPLLIGSLTSIFSFGIGILVISVIGIVGLVFMIFNVNETLDRSYTEEV